MRSFLRPLVIAFSVINLFIGILTIAACFIFPEYYWKATGLYIGKHFHSLLVPIILALCALTYLFFSLLLMHFFKRLTDRQNKLVSFVLWGAIFLFEVVIIFLSHRILPPAFDGGHTYTQAIDMLRHQNTPGIMNYFQIYPNNIGLTIIRYWIYRFICFGHTNLFLYADRIFCALALTLAIYFAWRFIVDSQNRKIGNVFLFLVLTCFPLFFYLTYFYTDSLALMFPSILLYMTYRLTLTNRTRYLVYCAILFAVGFQIRENLILMAPATLIYLLLVKKVKKALYLLIITLVLVVGVARVAQGFDEQMGFHRNMALQMPVTSWMVLGTSNAGRYNAHDYLLTRQQSTQKKKETADLHVIKDRVEKDGLIGLSKIWAIKDARTFADGSMGYYWYTRQTTDYSKPYNYLFGNRKELIVSAIQSIHIGELILFALAAIRLVRKKKYDENLYFQLCLFGSFLFYVFIWEAEPRYALLFSILQLTGCLYGLQELYGLAALVTRKARKDHLLHAAVMLGLTVLLIVTVLVGLKSRPIDTKIIDTKPYYVIDQSVSGKETIAHVRATQEIRQTFTTNRTFTNVRFRVLNHRGKSLNLAEVTAIGQNGGSIIGEKRINSTRLRKSGYVTIPIHTNKHSLNHHYLLTIRQLAGTAHSQLSLAMNRRELYEQMDLYPGGALYLNHQIQHKEDLLFQVYTKGNHPYLSEIAYLTLLSIPFLILLVTMYRFRDSSRKVSRKNRKGSSVNGISKTDA